MAVVGDDVVARAKANIAQQDAERELRKNQPLIPFRYYTKNGETSQIIIVDEKPTFMRREHALLNKRSGRYDVYVPCIDEYCACPACAVSQRAAYDAMYLTVIDLTQYYDSNDQLVEFSKKLLVVKPMQQKKLIRYYERHGTMRGMILEMTRDGDKAASIGDPEFIDFAPEDELQSYVSYYVDKENVEHEILCDEPYDYLAIMPDMSEDELRTLVGGEAPTGSRRGDDRALGRSARPAARGGHNDDDDGFQAPTRRVASRRAPVAAQEADPEDLPPEEPEEHVEQVARRATARASAAPARAAAPARQAPARPARAAARPAPVDNGLDPADDPSAGAEDPPFDVDPPQRSARSAPVRRPARPAPEPAAAAPVRPDGVAARRANLRRG